MRAAVEVGKIGSRGVLFYAIIVLLGGWFGVSCSTTRHYQPPVPGAYLPGPRPQFTWPVTTGRVSSGFGIRGGVMHDGIDISAPPGTPVHAAAPGRVIFSGQLRGYGNVVIVIHSDHYVTVYAHNSKNYVTEGQQVERGQVLGYVGRTGHTSGPHLHFEVRHNNVASNPLALLPRLSAERTRLAARTGS